MRYSASRRGGTCDILVTFFHQRKAFKESEHHPSFRVQTLFKKIGNQTIIRVLGFKLCLKNRKSDHHG